MHRVLPPARILSKHIEFGYVIALSFSVSNGSEVFVLFYVVLCVLDYHFVMDQLEGELIPRVVRQVRRYDVCKSMTSPTFHADRFMKRSSKL